MKKLPKKGKIDLGFSFGDSIVGFESKLRLPSDEQIKNSQDWDDGEIQSERSSSVSPWRLVPVYVIFAFLILILGARAFKLQIIEGATFLNRSEGNHVLIKVTHAPRGVIYDRNGKVLVRNVPGFRLAIRKIDLPDGWEQKIGNLANLIGKDKKEMIDTVKKSNTDSVTIADGLSNDQIITLKTSADSFPWLDIELNPKREYVYGPALAALLGYTNEASEADLKRTDTTPYSAGDQVGKAGIEQSFEQSLRGEDGYQLIKVDSQGKQQGVLFETQPIAGNDVTLSINADLQQFVYDNMTKVLQDKGGTGGSAIVTDPATGEILAMVSVPTYDDNIFSSPLTMQQYGDLINNPGHLLINRAIGAAYPPGSTFKIVMSAAGLESGTISKDTKITDTGFFTLDGITFNNWLWNDHHTTEGDISIVRAISRSNDTFFYNLGNRMGVDLIAKYATLFGMGLQTGINLSGETAGLVPTPAWKEQTYNQVWYPGETINYSIGQGYLQVSPIQLNLATAVFANGGKLVKPTLLRTNTAKVVRDNFIKPENLDTIRQGLYGNTIGDGNVSYLFKTFGLPTAGKTGSAESGGDRSHSWYTAYAPADNSKIAVTVMFEQAGNGSEVSAPVVKNIFKWYFKL